jgi:hypothetical protein
MTNNARPRHAAQGRASRIAGRTALGVLGAPVAMLAVAGPAGAAALDLDGEFDGQALDVQLAADDLALPAVDSLLPALPTELPDGLPTDGVAFEGVSLDLFDLAGGDEVALPALPVVGDVALPELPALPSTDDLPVALPSVPAVGDLGALPALPAVGDVALPALPSTDDLPVDLPALPVVGEVAVPELPALPSTDDLPLDTVTDLAGGLPTSAALDLDDVASTATDAVPAAADVFSATDLVSGVL